MQVEDTLLTMIYIYIYHVSHAWSLFLCFTSFLHPSSCMANLCKFKGHLWWLVVHLARVALLAFYLRLDVCFGLWSFHLAWWWWNWLQWLGMQEEEKLLTSTCLNYMCHTYRHASRRYTIDNDIYIYIYHVSHAWSLFLCFTSFLHPSSCMANLCKFKGHWLADWQVNTHELEWKACVVRTWQEEAELVHAEQSARAPMVLSPSADGIGASTCVELEPGPWKSELQSTTCKRQWQQQEWGILR